MYNLNNYSWLVDIIVIIGMGISAHFYNRNKMDTILSRLKNQEERTSEINKHFETETTSIWSDMKQKADHTTLTEMKNDILRHIDSIKELIQHQRGK